MSFIVISRSVVYFYFIFDVGRGLHIADTCLRTLTSNHHHPFTDFLLATHSTAAMAGPDGQYYCDCPRYCKQRKAVSRSTYFAHAKYRTNLTTTFDAYRAAHTQNVGNQLINEPRALTGNLQPHFHGPGSLGQNQVSNYKYIH